LKPVPIDHVVQLFDSAESRTTRLAAFVRQGLAAGESVVLFARSDVWKTVEGFLYSRGQCVGTAIARGQLAVFDAHETLDDLMKRGRPDRSRFSVCMARAIRDTRASRKTDLRVYGALVDVLAEEGNFTAALALEKLWNELLSSRVFTLMCGYSSVHFGNHLAGPALREICSCHSRIVESGEDDSLGSFLIADSRRPR
jgi:hypothetical protein